jgi:hypothetical protein
VTVMAATVVLAKGAVSNNNVTPGVLGFLVVAGMGLALFFLLKSMNRQFRKIPPPPPEEGAEGGPESQKAQKAQKAGISPGPPTP